MELWKGWVLSDAPIPLQLSTDTQKKQLRLFFEEGFLIKHNVFSKEELQPVIHDIEAQVRACLLARCCLRVCTLERWHTHTRCDKRRMSIDRPTNRINQSK